MALVASILYFALLVFLILLVVRLIMEYVFMFARSYRPTGFVAPLVVREDAFGELRVEGAQRGQYLGAPLRVGRVSLDLSWIVLFFLVQILMRVVAGLGA